MNRHHRLLSTAAAALLMATTAACSSSDAGSDASTTTGAGDTEVTTTVATTDDDRSEGDLGTWCTAWDTFRDAGRGSDEALQAVGEAADLAPAEIAPAVEELRGKLEDGLSASGDQFRIDEYAAENC